MYIVILLVLQYVPVHPGLHEEHTPLCMWHVLSLQLVGQGVSQLLPKTLVFLQPKTNIDIKTTKHMMSF